MRICAVKCHGSFCMFCGHILSKVLRSVFCKADFGMGSLPSFSSLDKPVFPCLRSHEIGQKWDGHHVKEVRVWAVFVPRWQHPWIALGRLSRPESPGQLTKSYIAVVEAQHDTSSFAPLPVGFLESGLITPGLQRRPERHYPGKYLEHVPLHRNLGAKPRPIGIAPSKIPD